MTEAQLYLAIGLPTLAVLVGVFVNGTYWSALNGRIGSLENRSTALESRFGGLEARIDARIGSIESKFDLLIGKVIDLDNRLVRLEERLKH